MGPVGSWKLTDFPDRSVRVIIVPDLFDAVVQLIAESVTETFDSLFLPCANNVQRKQISNVMQGRRLHKEKLAKVEEKRWSAEEGGGGGGGGWGGGGHCYNIFFLFFAWIDSL